MTYGHPSTEQLIEFSSGTGSSATSIAISAHLHFCQHCRRQVNEYESTAAVMFEQQTNLAVEETSFSSLMKRIQNEPQTPKIKPRITSTRFPAVVEKLINGDTESLAWKKPMKHLRVSQILKDEAGLILGLHHMKSGGRVPRHTHKGNEISVVIEGGFSDELGSYRPGDFIHLTPEHIHAPQADADGDCWLLTLVEAPVKLIGPIGWIINPFLKP